MEQQGESKNYTTNMTGAEDKKEAAPRKVSIHTMPKRYMTEAPAVKRKARGTGFLILLFGFVFLIIGLGVLYIALKPEPSVEPEKIVQENQVVPTTDKNEVEKKEEPKEEEQEKEVTKTDEEKPKDDPEEKEPEIIENEEDLETVLGDDYLSANDGDKDGLSDLEELLLGSSANSLDTDGDSYPDHIEVAGLYDPTSTGLLKDSVHIEVFENKTYLYSVFTSSVWTVETVHGYESLLIPLGQDQFFQIIANESDEFSTINDWYKEIFDVFELNPKQLYKNGDWEGVYSETGLTVYMKHPSKNYIITFNYELGSDNTLYYKNMFDMMLASFTELQTNDGDQQ